MHRRSLAAALLLALSAGCSEPQEPDPADAPGEYPAAGFQRVLTPRTFSFPQDHGAHRDFRHEWWYVTGNLDGPGGRRFGFQVTFFRFGLNAHPPVRVSRWAAAEAYMAHFAISDVAGGRFRAFQRRARGALGLAGAELAPFRVWLEDWRLQAASGDDFPWVLQVRDQDEALHLTLSSTKPMILQGQAGLSQKSAEPGNASYYYSGTRLEAQGTLETGGARFPVKGLAWLDREWSSSALAANQAGWDWFALQFDDGTELMYYRLRLKDGGDDPRSAGSFVDAQGGKTALGHGDVELKVLSRWSAPGGAEYPARWQMSVKPLGRRWLIQPALADQEQRGGSMRYWEGAVDVFDGERPDRPLARGYVEMTGYARAGGAQAEP